MRRANKRKGIFKIVLLIVMTLAILSIGTVLFLPKSQDMESDNTYTLKQATHESTNTVQTTKNAPNMAVEVVSVDKDAILNQEKESSINASKLSSLENALEELMYQTETE